MVVLESSPGAPLRPAPEFGQIFSSLVAAAHSVGIGRSHRKGAVMDRKAMIDNLAVYDGYWDIVVIGGGAPGWG